MISFIISDLFTVYCFQKVMNSPGYQNELIYVVLGNETCDLDSAVSSLVYGYTLFRKYGPNVPVLSVLNVDFADFNAKTEVVYHLKMCNIDVANIIFRFVAYLFLSLYFSHVITM